MGRNEFPLISSMIVSMEGMECRAIWHLHTVLSNNLVLLIFRLGSFFRDSNSEAARLFMQNNSDTPWLNPGQIVIVADPASSQTMHMLSALRQAKQQTNNAFVGVSSDDASFMQKHYGLIAALTTAGDKVFGTIGDVGERYFSEIENTLKKIETTYQNQFRTQGTLIS